MTFDRRLKLEFHGSKVTSDTGNHGEGVFVAGRNRALKPKKTTKHLDAAEKTKTDWKKIYKFIEQEENHKNSPRWSRVTTHMGNPELVVIQPLKIRWIVLNLIVTALAISTPLAHALSLLSGPTFTPAPQAPLAGTLQLTTDTDSRVSVLISDGTDVWEKDFYDFSTTHSLPLLGFKPGQTNQILVTVYDKDRNSATASQLLTFVTAPLPANFPHSVVLKNVPSQMEPGDTLFIIQDRSTSISYVIIVDNTGAVVWYSQDSQFAIDDVRQLDNGDLLLVEQPPGNCFLEINMLGETVNTLHPPAAYPVNSHEGLVTTHGTILYLSDVSVTVSNFPSVLPNQNTEETNPPLKTVQMDDNPVVEISATNGALLHAWSLVNLIDPTRVTYLTGDINSSYGTDNVHANAIIDDTNDNSIIVSMRDQNAVLKFSRATGQIKWILGSPTNWPASFQPYLLTPVGSPFNWNYGQHAPMLTPDGTLILYNDGDGRADPFDPEVLPPENYSSAEEFDINETKMQVSEVWNSAWQTNQDRLYTPVVGKAQWLPQTRDVLVTYGYISFVNGVAPSPNPSASDATMDRIIEYTHDPVPSVVFDLAFWDYDNTTSSYRGYLCYRATRIPDLYTHPVVAVSDLVVSEEDQRPSLKFSADPIHNYAIQASTDLKNWTIIGTPVESGGNGNFYFDDLNASQFAARFYRVVTQ